MKTKPSRMGAWKSEVGPGWHHLLDLANKFIPQYSEICGVSRLYGGLRITLCKTPPDRVLQELMDLEHISYNTCEECGGWEGVTTNKGGVAEMRTLCGGCRDV